MDFSQSTPFHASAPCRALKGCRFFLILFPSRRKQTLCAVSHFCTIAPVSPDQSCKSAPVKKAIVQRFEAIFADQSDIPKEGQKEQSCKGAEKARSYGLFDKKELHRNPDTHCIIIAMQLWRTRRHGVAARRGLRPNPVPLRAIGSDYLAGHAYKKTALRRFSAGVPGGIRTHGLQSRSLTRYPASLRVHEQHLLLYPICAQKASVRA